MSVTTQLAVICFIGSFDLFIIHFSINVFITVHGKFSPATVLIFIS